MLSSGAFAGIRAIAEKFFPTEITIYRKTTFAKDDSQPFGDDVVGYETTGVKLKCWVIDRPDMNFATQESQVIQAGITIVRVPFGTQVVPGDNVVLKGAEYTVVDSTSASDNAPWTLIYLKHIQ